jgi:hypothetical protein
MKLKPEDRVSLEVAKRRALGCLAVGYRGGYTYANAVAAEIWPSHQMTSQGAGAAASRILRGLEKEGLVWYGSNATEWGWQITAEGRAALSTGVLALPPHKYVRACGCPSCMATFDERRKKRWAKRTADAYWDKFGK